MTVFAPLLEHRTDVGEARSATDIEDHFERNYGIEGAIVACEYLADQGVIDKAGIAIQLMRRSTVMVRDLAFFALSDPDGAQAGGRETREILPLAAHTGCHSMGRRPHGRPSPTGPRPTDSTTADRSGPIHPEPPTPTAREETA